MTDWTQAFKCETRVAQIITQQELNGWQFDIDKAWEHVHWLDNESEQLFNIIYPMLGYVKDTKKRTCSRPFDKNTGGYSKKVQKLLKGSDLEVSGPFTYIMPILTERGFIQEKMLEAGWKPEEFTPTGQPKLMVDGEPAPSLLEVESEVGQALAKWYTYQHRRNTILNPLDPTKGWLNHVRDDGRISAQAIPDGTNTHRMTHKVVVNVPKAAPHVLFGKEMRELFIAKPGYVLVGHDASGLELRMLAHYMNDPEYTEILINGDLHTYHQELAGLPTRDAAKTFIYAFNYGAGDEKLGSIVGGSARDGKDLREKFLSNNKSLGRLIKAVQDSSRRGWLKGIDGRKVWMRKNRWGAVMAHKALNTLLQSAGAITMKYSMLFLDKSVRKYGLDSIKVGDFHDEAQAEVHPDSVEAYKEAAVNSIINAGKYLNLNCPLDAEAKVGLNWAETH